VRHLLTSLVLGWSLMTAAVALVVWLPEWWGLPFVVLVGLRFLFGVFQGGAFPSLSRMLTDWVPMRERATSQGLIWMSTRLGGMLSHPIVAVLIYLLGGWQMALVAIALVGVFWCAGFWPWFRNRPEEMPQVNAAERAVILVGRAASADHGSFPWR